jgi:hypothetical protein
MALKPEVGKLSASFQKANRDSHAGSSVVYVNSQNNRYWSIENLHATHELSVQDLRVEVWYAACVRSIIGPIPLKEQDAGIM